MNRIWRICRSLSGLRRRAGALFASAAAAPAVLATVPPLPPGWNHRPPMPLEYIFGPVVKVPGPTVVTGGTPGWQIALIAAGAALLAAVLAVIADRARAARRRQMAGTAEAIAHLTPCDPGPEEAAMNRVRRLRRSLARRAGSSWRKCSPGTHAL
jgi:hypothetical protein